MNDTKDLSVVQLSMFPANNEIYLGNGDEIDDDFSLDGFQVVRGELVCDRQELTFALIAFYSTFKKIAV